MANTMQKRSENALAELNMLMQNLFTGIMEYFRTVGQIREARQTYKLSRSNMPFSDMVDELRALVDTIEDQDAKQKFIDKIDDLVKQHSIARHGLDEINRTVQRSSLDEETKQRMTYEIQEIWRNSSGMSAVTITKEAWPQIRNTLAQKKGYNPYSYAVLPAPGDKYVLTFPSIYDKDVQNAINMAGLCLGNIKNCTSRKDMEIVAIGSARNSDKATMMTFHNIPAELAMKAVNESDYISQFAFGMEPKGDGTYDLFCIGGEDENERSVSRTYATEMLWKAALKLNGPGKELEMQKMHYMLNTNNKVAQAIESLSQNDTENTRYYVYDISNTIDSPLNPDNYVTFDKNAMTEYVHGRSIASIYSDRSDYTHIVRVRVDSTKSEGQRLIMTEAERNSILQSAEIMENKYRSLSQTYNTNEEMLAYLEQEKDRLYKEAYEQGLQPGERKARKEEFSQTAQLYEIVKSGKEISRESFEYAIMKDYLNNARFKQAQIEDGEIYQKYCNYVSKQVRDMVAEKSGGYEVKETQRSFGKTVRGDEERYADVLNKSNFGFSLSDFGNANAVKEYTEKIRQAIDTDKHIGSSNVQKQFGFRDADQAMAVVTKLEKNPEMFKQCFRDAENMLKNPIVENEKGEQKSITVTNDYINTPFELRGKEYPYMQAAKMHVQMHDDVFRTITKDRTQSENRDEKVTEERTTAKEWTRE